MTQQQCFTLDGVTIPFDAGDSIMQAASKAGIHIPHLCFHPQLPAHGSCRLCVVQLRVTTPDKTGYKTIHKTIAACTHPASVGQQIQSATPELKQMRLHLIQLLFAEGNHYCPSCEASGNCQLQGLAYEMGMTHYHYDPFNPVRTADSSHPDLFIDRDRCIQCDLCGRASSVVDHKQVYGLAGRGSASHLFFRSASGTLQDTAAASDDLASHICPVGCILPKTGNYAAPIGTRRHDSKPDDKVAP